MHAYRSISSGLDHRIDLHPEPQYSSSPMHLLPCVFEAIEVSEILCRAPCHSLAVVLFVVLLNQLLGVFKILCNGLL